METTVKVKLLKRHYKREVGDVIEVRPMEAQALKAVKVAEDYVEPAPVRERRATTRVMQPETATSEATVSEAESTPSEETNTSGANFGRYNRRDMQPKE